MHYFAKRLFHILKTVLSFTEIQTYQTSALKIVFEESGGAFIKLSQILALRRDFCRRNTP